MLMETCDTNGHANLKINRTQDKTTAEFDANLVLKFAMISTNLNYLQIFN